MQKEIPEHMVVVGGLVRDESGRVLLIRHYQRGWEIPQGRVEEGENLYEAFRREVLEETGVTLTQGPLAAVWSKVTPPVAVIFTFLADYAGGDLRTSEESPEIGWFSAEEAMALVSHPVNLERLRTLLDYSGKTVYRAYRSTPFQVEFEAYLQARVS